jgi:hypothetical protein
MALELERDRLNIERELLGCLLCSKAEEFFSKKLAKS